MEIFTIGQLAKRVNVNLETIRYYERRGLIPEPPRNQSGHRQYPGESATLMKFIKQSQALGFSLNEISELLSLKVEPGITCAVVKERVESKIVDVDKKIADLKQIKRALISLAQKCKGVGPVNKCPILEELNNQAKER